MGHVAQVRAEAPRRRWTIADVVFDEARWELSVAGKPVALEGKPLDILRYMLAHPNIVVTKTELLDAVWPDVEVVEASLPTAIHKLRAAIGDERREKPLIETVPRVGYRLNGEVSTGGSGQPAAVQSAHSGTALKSIWMALAAVAIALFAGLVLLPGSKRQIAMPAKAAAVYSDREIIRTVRRLDVAALERMIDDGWNPNQIISADGNSALQIMIEICEWDPGHDRQRLLLAARTLLDGGASIIQRNKWGDTAYSIAKADRFCGPRHPVTIMLYHQCFNGIAVTTYGKKCLATYELATPKR